MTDIGPYRITTIQQLRENPNTTFYVYPSNATLQYISNPGLLFKLKLNNSEIYVNSADLSDYLVKNEVYTQPKQSAGRYRVSKRSYKRKSRTYKRKNRAYKRRSRTYKKRSHKHKY